MTSKLVVRYFYNPICPESFATLDRLNAVFNNKNKILFEKYNVIQDVMKSEKPWFEEERKLINTCYGNGEKPLLYAKLFIDGEEIEGFPPSKNHIKEILINKKLSLDIEKYIYHYGTCLDHERVECKSSEFMIISYKDNYEIGTCKACTKYHPYLHESIYELTKWEKYEKQKYSYIKNRLFTGDMFGFSVYYYDRPAGFIEAFDKSESIKLGYPTLTKNEDELVITCLSICAEFTKYGLANKLIGELENQAKQNGYKFIEVLCFPDDHNWQPYTLYSKIGFIKEKEYNNGLVLMKKLLNN